MKLYTKDELIAAIREVSARGWHIVVKESFVLSLTHLKLIRALDTLLYKIFYFIYQGFYTFEGPEKTKIVLVKNLRPKWAAAQTLGNNIFVNYIFEPKEYFPHEYIHVLQYRKYGALFFILYD